MHRNYICQKELKPVNRNRSGNHFYHPDTKAVYYLDKAKNLSVIEHVQYDYVAILNTFFCQYRHYDKQAIYYKQFKIKDVDFDSFQILHGKLAKDKNRVYYGQLVISEADSQSFEVLINSYDNNIFLGKDRYRIYNLSKKIDGQMSFRENIFRPIAGVNASGFEFIGRFWARDYHNVLCRLKPVKEIDAKTFKVLFSDGKNEWAKDKNNLYNGKDCKIYYEMDGSTLRVLNEFWCKDEQSVFSFYTKNIIHEADTASFEVLGLNDKAEDKNHYYEIDEKGEITKIRK